MNYTAEKYQGNEWAIYCKTSACYVLFGSQKRMKQRAKELNNENK